MGQPSRASLRDVLRAAVAAERPLRVWSLVVTIFGDAVAPRGGELWVGTLTEIAAGLGIGGGALRTALSRLAADGLIERRKIGRNSYARLTRSATAPFRAASGRIYALGGPAWSGAWSVAILPEAGNGEMAEARAALDGLGYRPIGTAAMIAPLVASGRVPAGDAIGGAVLLTAAASPEDARRLAGRFCPLASAAADYAGFIERFAPVRAAVGAADDFERLLARILMVHAYRRVLLRYPPLPDALVPPDFPGKAARALAAEIYDTVREPSERWLDAHALNADGPLPPPAEEFRHRFAAG
jgi:phenylacetic acid degradation operon negative regulatory protein